MYLLREIRVSTGQGRYRIDILAVVTGEGISVTLTGGEKPHVGGTVLCIPRSGRQEGQTSCDMWVVPVPGHKDTVAAARVGEMLCQRQAQPVVVVAGIHIKDATAHEIEILLDNCESAAEMLLGELDR